MQNIFIKQGVVLVEPNTATVTLGNGITTQNTTVSRQKIVSGVIVKSAVQGKEIGMTVHYPYYAADEFQLADKQYHIVKDDDVLIWEGL